MEPEVIHENNIELVRTETVKEADSRLIVHEVANNVEFAFEKPVVAKEEKELGNEEGGISLEDPEIPNEEEIKLTETGVAIEEGTRSTQYEAVKTEGILLNDDPPNVSNVNNDGGITLVEPDIEKDEEFQLEVVESKNNDDGKNEYKIKLTKYFWVNEDNLQGYEKLVNDFLLHKQTITEDSPSPVFTPSKRKRMKKKKKLAAETAQDPQQVSSNVLSYLFSSDSEEETDGNGETDADFVPSQSSLREKNFMKKERKPRSASFGGINTPVVIPSNVSKKQKRKNSSPIKVKLNLSGEQKIHENRYTCSFCTRSYLRLSECRKHERIHTGNNPYYCRLCDVHNLKPSKLKAHLLTKNHIRRATIKTASSKNPTCSVCLLEFNNATELEEHELTEHARCITSSTRTRASISQITAIPATTSFNSNQLSMDVTVQEGSSQGQTGGNVLADGNVAAVSTTTLTTPQQVAMGNGTMDNTTQNDAGNTDDGVASTSGTNCRIITDPTTGKQRYQCHHCVKSFINRKMFRMHLRIHDGTNPYYCPVCQQYFLKRVELKKHLTTNKHLDKVSENIAAGIEVIEIDPSKIAPPTNKVEINCLGPEITYQCKHCEKKFLCKRSLTQHEKVHTGTSRHYCQLCNKHFHRKIHLQYHKWSVHTETLPFKCDVCSARFRIPYDLKKHQLIHPSCKICNTCKKEFDSASQLTEHLKESSSCIGYKCGICECIFMDQKAYDKHIVRHNEQHMVEITAANDQESTKYQCKHCTKEFISKKSCREHLSVHLGTSRHFCDLCNEYFANRNQLESHKSTSHSQECPYQCDVCSASFKLLSNLKIHKSTHVNDKKCKTCDQEFESSFLLKEHLKVSSTCLSFKCEECNMIFIEKKKHREHMKVKHGIGDTRRATNQHGNFNKFKTTPRNHVCTICSEAFTQATALRQHMEWHKTGRYPNQCPDCDRPFFSKWKLDRHITTVHMGLRQYECEVCSKDFKTKSALKYHVMKEHEHNTLKCDTCNKEFMTSHGHEQHKAQFCKASPAKRKLSNLTGKNSELDLNFSVITPTEGSSSTTTTTQNATHYTNDDSRREATIRAAIDLVIDRPSPATNSIGSYVGSNSATYSSSAGSSSKLGVSSPFLVENIVPHHGGGGVNDNEIVGNQKAMPSISSFFQVSYANSGALYSSNMVDTSSINLNNSSGPSAPPHQSPVSFVSSNGKSMTSLYPYRPSMQGNVLAPQSYVSYKDSRLNTPLEQQQQQQQQHSEQIQQPHIHPPIHPRIQDVHHGGNNQQRSPQSEADRFTFAQAILQNQYQYL